MSDQITELLVRIDERTSELKNDVNRLSQQIEKVHREAREDVKEVRDDLRTHVQAINVRLNKMNGHGNGNGRKFIYGVGGAGVAGGAAIAEVVRWIKTLL